MDEICMITDLNCINKINKKGYKAMFSKYIKQIKNGSFYIEALDNEEKYKQIAYFITEAKNIFM